MTIAVNSQIKRSALNVVTGDMDIYDKEANEEAARDYIRILTQI